MNETQMKMRALLKDRFGFDDFRPGQAEVLTALLVDQQNVLAVLPTGTGKSLLYEYAGHVLGGTTVIVSPLLSLMQDQVSRLNYHGERQAVAINSMMKPSTKNFALQHLEQFRYIFIAPETLIQEPVMLALQRVAVKLFVVDEAHSIAQWGPDFRPDYLELGRAYKQLGKPRLLALTATASQQARHEILAQFDLPVEPQIILYSINRPNIHLRTEQLADDKTKQQRLLTLVKSLPGAGIIYLSSKKLADQLVITLQQATDRRVAAYHGDVASDQRYAVQQQFMTNQLDVIVATSAFGMGIDKADIRWVIHYHLSNDLEAYVQEIGRAGRDQQPALAVLLYGQNDEYLVRNLIETSLPVPGDVQHYYKRTPNYTFDPQHEHLLSYYQGRGLNADQVTQLFKQRINKRYQALSTMLAYIELQTDKRNFLLKSFDEATLPLDEADNWSTEQTPLDIAALNLPNPVEQLPILGLPGWQATLENLFGTKPSISGWCVIQLCLKFFRRRSMSQDNNDQQKQPWDSSFGSEQSEEQLPSRTSIRKRSKRSTFILSLLILAVILLAAIPVYRFVVDVNRSNTPTDVASSSSQTTVKTSEPSSSSKAKSKAASDNSKQAAADSKKASSEAAAKAKANKAKAASKAAAKSAAAASSKEAAAVAASKKAAKQASSKAKVQKDKDKDKDKTYATVTEVNGYRFALAHGLSLGELQTLNPGVDLNSVHPGQSLRVK